MIRFRALGSLDLSHADGNELRPLLTGPKRLALLAYLAIDSPGQFQRRDTLLGLLWPESADRQARGSLRNTLHVLRQFLGADVVENSGADEVRIAPGTLWCDVVAFREAVEAGRWAEAIELYRGDLLPGLHVPGAPGFEDWLSRERDSLNRAAFEAAWALAEAEEEAGNFTAAARHARHATTLCTLDEEAVRRLMRLLDRLGDRAGALTAYEEFAERLRAELLGEPAPETVDLAEAIRNRRQPHRVPTPTNRDTADAPGAEEAPEEEAPEDAGSPGVDSSDLGDVEAAGPSADLPGGSDASIPADPVATAATTGAADAGAGEYARPGESQPAPMAADSMRGTSPVPLPRRRGFAWSAVAACFVVLLGLVFGIRARAELGGRSVDRPIYLAVGEVETFGGELEAGAGEVLPSMLSTNLARAEEVRVVSRARLYELLAGDDARGSLARAAREAGADELLEGSLIRMADGLLRLDLRRIDLHTGELHAAYRVEGTDPFVLVDRATERLFAAFGLSQPATGIAAVSTHSLLAYRLYEEGLRAYAEGDNRTAQRLLTAALDEDSTFAMAAYYRAQSSRRTDDAAFRHYLHRAAQLAYHATDRERLLIQAAWAQAMDDPAQSLYADSLVARFPTEPDGHLFLGKARLWSGDFVGAMPHLRRVVEMDSLSLHGKRVRCLACDAIADIVYAYILADSLPTAEREARRWTELQPGSARAWHALGSTLEYQSRLAEAQVARNRAAELRSDNPRDPLFPAVLALRAGDFERADWLLDELDAPGTSLVQQNVLWYRVLSLRDQGRVTEALPVAREYTQALQEADAAGHAPLWAQVLEAHVLLVLGRHAEAAELWRRMSDVVYDSASPARSARHRAWTLTHAATALAAAGDTTPLPALADSIEAFGSQSAFGRDPRLHHFIGGLLFAARGDTVAAVEAYRNAIFSANNGYARINLELGRALLALGQPLDAAHVATAALRGPLDSGNLYVPRTELHELAGYAWEAAGRPDSALAHYRWVVNAWKDAEPSFAKRRREIERRLARLTL